MPLISILDPKDRSCPICSARSGFHATIEAEQYHTCDNGHHWHIDPDTGEKRPGKYIDPTYVRPIFPGVYISDALQSVGKCPVCGQSPILTCNCTRCDSKCPNGHRWYYDEATDSIKEGWSHSV